MIFNILSILSSLMIGHASLSEVAKLAKMCKCIIITCRKLMSVTRTNFEQIHWLYAGTFCKSSTWLRWWHSPMSHQKVWLLISTFPGKYSNNLIISRFPCRHQINLKHSNLSSSPLAFLQKCFFPQSSFPPRPKCLGPSSHPPRNLLRSLQITPQCPCSPCWKSQTASLRWFHKSL